jgi:subtilisin family serine protease
VEYVEPNYVVHAMDTPNDPMYNQLWGLPKISAPSAWDISTGSAANVVGVVDTGIDYNHPDLAANVWSAPSAFTVTISGNSITCPTGSHGFNAITNTCDPMDDNNHGTHVSGTIGAVGNNNAGVAGVNWAGSIMGLKFLSASGSGYTSDAIEAIEFAIQAKQAFGAGANVMVLSNSWGGGGYSQSLLNEINKANTAGMLFVAAAGNSAANNDRTANYPSNYNAPNVVAVAATDSNDRLASFSNYGATTVDLGAPGVGIVSTIPGGNYASYSGTSMATPHVSGAAALVLSKCTLDTAGLKADILNNVDPVSSLAGKTLTGGRLDVNKAIRACIAPTTSTTTTLIASPTSSTYGDPVTFTATVTPSGGSGTPTGTVTFYDGGSSLGARTLSGGTASLTTSALSGGSHSITATYGGDSSFSGSTSQSPSYMVAQAPTSTSLTSTLTNSQFGQTVTFTATVSSSTTTPAGTVTFLDGSTALGTGTLNSGSASFSTSTLAVGSHSITATYDGNSNYQASTSNSISLSVSKATSTTSLSSSPNPSTVGQSVTFTATVSPAAATGLVTFSDGSTTLGSANLISGKASFSTSSLSVGSHTIKATYSGDTNVIGSTSPTITQVVNSADFSISASPSSRTVSRGSTASYTITITRISGFAGSISLGVTGQPSGSTVSFSANPVTNTRSTLSVRTRSSTPRGTYTLTITGTSGSLSHTTTVTLTVR